MDMTARIVSRLRDPRWYQVLVLSLLLGFGILVLDFGIHWENAVAVFLTAQAVQFLASRYLAHIPYEPLSALITSFSLTLLLRTEFASLAMLAAVIAIGSKFVVRVRGKHVFNPANVALVSMMLLTDRAWVSSGQWGSATIGALVAVIAYAIRFVLYEPNAPILALIIAAPLVPVIDAISHGRIYRWNQPAAGAAGQVKGVY